MRSYRHTLPVRLGYWLNVLCLLILIMSGLQIFNAHPALYWGDRSDRDRPLLSMRAMITERGERRGITTVGGIRAKEFTLDDGSPVFPANGTSDPESEAYRDLARNGFADWTLEIGGLVHRPAGFSLDELRALPSRTQLMRHDCVEGWSAIAKWKGVKLSELLERVRPLPSARYIVFHCADPDEEGQPYYESIDFEDGHHPQTILAYEINDEVLPIRHGAPVRLRVERQLGYKQAKYIMRIELVESVASIAGGKGGYWEDRGYEWYAGI